MINHKKRFQHTLIAGVFLASPSLAQDKWDSWDKALGATALVSTVADWGQTRYIVRHPDRYYETNALLGRHPTLGDVNVYFATKIVIGGFVAHYLPSKDRKVFLGVMSAISIYAVHHNAGIGVKIEF